MLVAASGVEGVRAGVHLDAATLAKSMIDYVARRSPPTKHAHGVEEKLLVASAQYRFPEERRLVDGDHARNVEKIRAIGNPYLGVDGVQALVASGGLCAPLTPLYDIPNFAVNDRPVRDALPSFQAERGGISVPTRLDHRRHHVGDHGHRGVGRRGWRNVRHQVLSGPDVPDLDGRCGRRSSRHCREYGNLNARAWPEGIAHENDITMAAHARTAEARLLDRIKSLSINVTGGAATLSAWSHFVYAVTRTQRLDAVSCSGSTGTSASGCSLPSWLPDLLVTDQVSAQFDRFMALEEATATLALLRGRADAGTRTRRPRARLRASRPRRRPRSTTSRTSRRSRCSRRARSCTSTAASSNSGIVRDSTLNSTNDYQVFGETFENVARIGPTQAARWASITICPAGTFPATGTGSPASSSSD